MMRRATTLITAMTISSFLGPAWSSERAPVVRLEVARTVQAVTYRPGRSTKIDFRGTELMPRAEGAAKVSPDTRNTEIRASFRGIEPPYRFGPYLVYVLWAISPEGGTTNLGEVVLNKGRADIETSTRLTSFALIVTAEPYYAVAFPSQAVVLENLVRKDTEGTAEPVSAREEIFKRGQYENVPAPSINPRADIPSGLYQARHAVAIARSSRADEYGGESWAKAQNLLQEAESLQESRSSTDRKQVPGIAHQAVQAAEDARAISVKRAEDARILAEKLAAAEREARAKSDAEADAARRAAAEEAAVHARQEAERAQKEAERAQQEAEKARQESERARKESAEAQQVSERAQQEREKAQQETERAKQAAAEAAQAKAAADEARLAALAAEESARAEAEAAKKSGAQLRAQLLDQFNQVLPTRDTPRGLVVNLGGVNFATGKAEVSSDARERLARLSGLVAPYPGLRLEIEGHTDNVGNPDQNQRLSEARAAAVRDYLVRQWLKSDAIMVRGLGDTMPLMSNDTAEGRALNRRVEIIVSGEVIGTKIGG